MKKGTMKITDGGDLSTERLFNEMRENLPMDKLFSRKDAAKELGISLSTLDRARENGRIAFIQYTENGCVFFREQDLQEFIAKGVHRSCAPRNVFVGRRQRT